MVVRMMPYDIPNIGVSIGQIPAGDGHNAPVRSTIITV